MDENTRYPNLAVKGQVLAPVEQPSLPRAPLDVPFLVEISNWSQRRQLESYVRLYRVQNEMLDLLVRQRQLTADLFRAREMALVQIRNLPSLREIEELKIQRELFELRGDAEIRTLRLAVQKEELEVRLAEAKLRRKTLESEPVKPASVPSRTPEEQVADSLEKIRKMDVIFQGHRANMLGNRTEEQLSDEEAQGLEKLEILRQTYLEKLYEDMLP